MSEDNWIPKLCNQCKKFLMGIPKMDRLNAIELFCDDVCLNSYVCEQTAESKDEMLQAISYANNRQDLEAEL